MTSAPLRLGSLFSGYGGLEMAANQVLGSETAWVSDVCKFDKDGNAGHYEPHRGPCRILAHRFADVPNLGDVTRIDWSTVEPVDILTGGSPCQDLSHAGKRGGMTEGTRSNLWVTMREAIAQLRPQLVIWENVRGAYSAAASSDLEFCSGCMGDTWDREPVLRALGRVLGDLADLGFDAEWTGIRAADVGAPHGRFRVFVVAYPRGAAVGIDTGVAPRPQAGPDEGHGPQHRGGARALLPTPAVNDMGEGKTVEAWDEWTAKMQAAHGNGNGHGKSLSIEAQRLLPTPDASGGAGTLSGTDRDTWRPSLELAVRGWEPSKQRPKSPRTSEPNGTPLALDWGIYAAAVARWEALMRPAPAPTQPSQKGTPQLSAAFSEWMMGLPAGWVTDVPGITRSEALKALGNGVVPQQAAAALRSCLARVGVAA